MNKINNSEYKIYKTQQELINDINSFDQIINLENDYKKEIIANKDFYYQYFENLNILKHIINKIQHQIQLQKVNNEILISEKQYKNIIIKYKSFTQNLKLIEQQNIKTIKKFNFTTKQERVITRVNKIFELSKKNVQLFKELKWDLNLMKNKIKIQDLLLLQMLRYKKIKLAKLYKYDNFINYIFSKNNFSNQYGIEKFFDNIINFTNQNLNNFDKQSKKYQKTKIDLKLDFQIQEFTIKNIFSLTNANIFEVYEILKKRLILNEKETFLLSDPKIDDVLYYNNQNNLISFLKLLKIYSKAVNNQFIKYYNYFENSKINYYEQNVYYYFNLFLLEIMFEQIVEEHQIKEVKKQITKIFIEDFILGIKEIFLLKSIYDNENYQNWKIDQNKFEFDNVFVDDIELNCTEFANAIYLNKNIQNLISMLIAYQMFKNLDFDDAYIINIEKYLIQGNQNPTTENVKILNIDLLNSEIIDKLWNYLEKRT